MRGYVLLSLLSACSFREGLAPGDGHGGGGSDGSMMGSDGSMMGSDGGTSAACYGPTGWQVCVPTAPADIVSLSGTNPDPFDTSTNNAACLSPTPASWTDAGQPDACIVVHGQLTFSGRVSGPRPLVLVAATQLTVNGLNASSQIGDPPGPGSPSPDCDAGTLPDENGGGAGGSFGMPGGGAGGDAGGDGGTPGGTLTAKPTKLRAGCPGQLGGDGGNGPGGTPGAGGGAVYLLSGGNVTLTGNITVSGAGGAKGATKSGGSGGGSGGLLVINGQTITATGAHLSANGGGGAGGSSPGQVGDEGHDPDPMMPLKVPAGGAMVIAGGSGYANGMAASGGRTGDSNNGGGGGGGGAGYIGANHAMSTGGTSPVADPSFP